MEWVVSSNLNLVLIISGLVHEDDEEILMYGEVYGAYYMTWKEVRVKFYILFIHIYRNVYVLMT